MKDPTKGYAVDQKKLRKFVSKVARDAKRQFQGEDGESLVDIAVRDCSRQDSMFGLPVPHLHRLETDAEWREAISFMICNASSALNRLTAAFNLYKNNRDLDDSIAAFLKDVGTLAKRRKITILSCRSELHGWPPPPEGTCWKRTPWRTTEELHASTYRTKCSWTETDRKNAIVHISAMIEKFAEGYGTTLSTFCVVIDSSSVRVMGAVPK